LRKKFISTAFFLLPQERNRHCLLLLFRSRFLCSPDRRILHPFISFKAISLIIVYDGLYSYLTCRPAFPKFCQATKVHEDCFCDSILRMMGGWDMFFSSFSFLRTILRTNQTRRKRDYSQRVLNTPSFSRRAIARRRSSIASLRLWDSHLFSRTSQRTNSKTISLSIMLHAGRRVSFS
jgi:hypothetical protein